MSTQITSRIAIDEQRSVVTFEEPDVAGWGVLVGDRLTIRGAMSISLVESFGADARERAAERATRLAEMIRFDRER